MWGSRVNLFFEYCHCLYIRRELKISKFYLFYLRPHAFKAYHWHILVHWVELPPKFVSKMVKKGYVIWYGSLISRKCQCSPSENRIWLLDIFSHMGTKKSSAEFSKLSSKLNTPMSKRSFMIIHIHSNLLAPSLCLWMFSFLASVVCLVQTEFQYYQLYRVLPF